MFVCSPANFAYYLLDSVRILDEAEELLLVPALVERVGAGERLLLDPPVRNAVRARRVWVGVVWR